MVSFVASAGEATVEARLQEQQRMDEELLKLRSGQDIYRSGDSHPVRNIYEDDRRASEGESGHHSQYNNDTIEVPRARHSSLRSSVLESKRNPSQIRTDPQQVMAPKQLTRISHTWRLAMQRVTSHEQYPISIMAADFFASFCKRFIDFPQSYSLSLQTDFFSGLVQVIIPSTNRAEIQHRKKDLAAIGKAHLRLELTRKHYEIAYEFLVGIVRLRVGPFHFDKRAEVAWAEGVTLSIDTLLAVQMLEKCHPSIGVFTRHTLF